MLNGQYWAEVWPESWGCMILMYGGSFTGSSPMMPATAYDISSPGDVKDTLKQITAKMIGDL